MFTEIILAILTFFFKTIHLWSPTTVPECHMAAFIRIKLISKTWRSFWCATCVNYRLLTYMQLCEWLHKALLLPYVYCSSAKFKAKDTWKRQTLLHVHAGFLFGGWGIFLGWKMLIPPWISRWCGFARTAITYLCLLFQLSWFCSPFTIILKGTLTCIVCCNTVDYGHNY